VFTIEKIKKIGQNILYLATGNITSQLLGFLFNIYIARTLGASEYGIFSTVSAFTGMFAFLTFDGYQKVAIRECSGDKEKTKTTIESILGIKTALSVLAVIVTILASIFFDYSKTIMVYISIFSFTLLFSSIRSLLHVVYHINYKMKYIVYTGLIQKLIYIIPAGICLWFNGGVEYLIIFFVLSTFFDMLINFYIINNIFSVSLSLGNIFRYRINLIFFKEAFVFSLLGFIAYFYELIDIAMLSWMVSAESVGLYAAGYKLIAPIQMLGRVVRVAFFPKFIESFKTGEQVKSTDLFKMSAILAVCLVPLSLSITIFAEEIILYTFGSQYSGSADVLKYLCWMFPFSIVTFPFVLSIQANHHEKKLILPNILRSISNVILNYIFIKKYGYMGAVYSTAITYFWYYLSINFGYQYYILKKAGNIV